MGNGKKEGHMHLDVDGNALNIVPQLNFNEAFPFYSTGDATVQTLSSSASPSFHDFTAPSSLFPLVCSVKADHMWGPLKKNSSMIDQTNVGWDFFCIVNVRSSTGNGRFSAYFSVTEKMWNTNEGKKYSHSPASWFSNPLLLSSVSCSSLSWHCFSLQCFALH